MLPFAFLCAIWLWAAVAKLEAIDQFKDVVRTIIPSLGKFSALLCSAIIACEAATGFSLLFQKTRRMALTTSCGLSIVFIGANLIRINEGIKAPCSCFGKIFTMSPAVVLGLDLVLLATSYALMAKLPNGESRS